MTVETRKPTNPVVIVVGTVVVVAILTLLIYKVGGGYKADRELVASGTKLQNVVPTGACGFGSPDDSYTVTYESDPDPPKAEGATFRLTVRHDGKPVTGAKVCVTADMPTMQHPGLNTLAKEGSGGRYETVLKFGMGGAWRAGVTIAEPGKPVVSVTVLIQVAEVQAS